MLPVLVSLLPFSGLILAALGAYAWLRDFRGEVRQIKDNHLPHILEATEDQTHEIRELRADLRTYFAPAPATTVTVSPVISAGNVSQRTKTEHAVPA
jgi:hypothetical protein